VLSVYVIKTCSSFGNLKMDTNEGVQSFNFEVGQKFKSFKEFESQLKHYQDAKVTLTNKITITRYFPVK
jgi:hypothetical protein